MIQSIFTTTHGYVCIAVQIIRAELDRFTWMNFESKHGCVVYIVILHDALKHDIRGEIEISLWDIQGTENVSTHPRAWRRHRFQLACSNATTVTLPTASLMGFLSSIVQTGGGAHVWGSAETRQSRRLAKAARTAPRPVIS